MGEGTLAARDVAPRAQPGGLALGQDSLPRIIVQRRSLSVSVSVTLTLTLAQVGQTRCRRRTTIGIDNVVTVVVAVVVVIVELRDRTVDQAVLPGLALGGPDVPVHDVLLVVLGEDGDNMLVQILRRCRQRVRRRDVDVRQVGRVSVPGCADGILRVGRRRGDGGSGSGSGSGCCVWVGFAGHVDVE